MPCVFIFQVVPLSPKTEQDQNKRILDRCLSPFWDAKTGVHFGSPRTRNTSVGARQLVLGQRQEYTVSWIFEDRLALSSFASSSRGTLSHHARLICTRMDSLCVRFHYRGRLEYINKEWKYVGGRSAMSTVPITKLTLADLKRHLCDYMVLSDEDLLEIRLSWRLIEKENNFMCCLDDNTSVNSMARYVTRVADGFVEIFAKHPHVASSDEGHEEFPVRYQVEHGQRQIGHEQHQVEHGQQKIGHEQHQTEQEQHQEQHQVEHEQHPIWHEDQHPFWHQEQHQVEHEQHEEQHQVEQQVEYDQHQEQPNVARKLSVVRAAKRDKGKEIQEEHEEDVGEDSSDSDYEDVHELDSADSSGEDEEAICYRKQAQELKKRVKIQMLGEDEQRATRVPEEFIVPENLKEEQEDGSDCFDSEEELSYDEDSDGSVRTRKTKHRVYDESAEVQEFEVGQAFHDSRQFKQALVNYGLKNFKHIIFPKDERTRVLAKCSWIGCNWSIYGSLVPNRSPWFTVSRYNNVHHCVARRSNKLVTSTVIAEKYFREIKDNPGWRIEKMQERVLEDLCADVSESKCKRAKRIVMERIVDGTNGEFSRVYDYHLELVRSNPGSTVSVTLNPDVTDRPVFERIYVCLEGCKRGFLAGCRRVVGLDGCFLKGAVCGQILCAIGQDPNNQMYPIAWATVEGENHDSWYWFLSLLQKDIQINNQGDGWVIISDQQKGLIKAVNEIIPEAEHRMCARHIYANWRKQHRDKAFQKLFWACAKSSDSIQFNYNRAKLALKTPEGARDMMKTAPEHWCRANFRLGSYCDSVENNLCESFNNAIMRARFYRVISSMEIMRRKVMARIAENKAKSEGWVGTIGPNIFKKLKLNVKRSNICTVLYNGTEGFEVMEGTWRRFTVNLESYTCSCRYWDLSGLPCCHAISAIYTVKRDLDDFIAPCYRIDLYNHVYSHVLQPVEGKESWPVAPNPRPFPPLKKKMPGRPKTERRREEQEKPKGNKLSRKGVSGKCSACGGGGHNKRKCTSNPDVVGEHAHKKKQSNTARRKANKKCNSTTAQEGQQQEKHVLYYEKKARPRKKSTTLPQTPAHRPFIPPKKRKMHGSDGTGQSSSRASTQLDSQSSSGLHIPRMPRRETETIPMSKVVTEEVPKYERMKWLLGEKKKHGGHDGAQ